MKGPAAGARLIADGAGQVRVEGVLDFASVNPLLAAGDALLEPNGRLAIDLGGVSAANSAGLALLLEWMDLARARRVDLRYLNLPDSLRRIADFSNLQSLFPAAES